jgi:hypothetical protein
VCRVVYIYHAVCTRKKILSILAWKRSRLLYAIMLNIKLNQPRTKNEKGKKSINMPCQIKLISLTSWRHQWCIWNFLVAWWYYVNFMTYKMYYTKTLNYAGAHLINKVYLNSCITNYFWITVIKTIFYYYNLWSTNSSILPPKDVLD